MYLIDVCIGAFVEKEVAKILKEQDFKFVRNINPRMSDDEILKIAFLKIAFLYSKAENSESKNIPKPL